MDERPTHDPIQRTDFATLADAVCEPLAGTDRSLLWIEAETSDFVRFTRARVRQSTRVRQVNATLSLVRGQRRIDGTVTLSGDPATDRIRLLDERARLLDALPMVPEDPWLSLPDHVHHSERHDAAELPEPGDAIDAILPACDDLDMAGFLAAGPMVRAFADSRGQRNWHRVASLHFDWSLFVAGGGARAVKSSFSTAAWQAGSGREALGRRIAQAREHLAALEQAPITLERGAYRAYLAPAAVAELLDALAWGGFSRKARASGTSPLSAFADGRTSMHAAVSIDEATDEGLAPAFTTSGFVRPARIALVDAGANVGCLTSPRSASEYGVTANADAAEHPASIALAAGELPAARVASIVGDGVWISNLWYVNYSDRNACRLTGMTRFACFAVKDGRIAAPIAPMRFDDVVTELLGARLVGLTRETEFLPDNHTWGARSLRSVRTPGIVVDGLRFTL